MHRSVRSYIVLAVSAVSIGACASSRNHTAPATGRTAGTIVSSIRGEPRSFNRNVARDITTEVVTGSGVSAVDIYVSDDGGPFNLALVNVTSASTVFSGQFGHTYGFYSIARDRAGNFEDAKTVADATTRVVDSTIDSTAPVIVPQIAGTLGANGWYVSGVTVTWTVVDAESGIASSSGCGGTTVTADTNGVTLTCAATNGAGLSSSAAVTLEIDKTGPTISGLPAGACTLWPPNRRLVHVATVAATDPMSGLAAFGVAGSSNEPLASGDIAIIGSGLGTRVVQVRADRLGSGTGRTYLLNAVARDLAGNETVASATCLVPHDAPK